MSSGLPVVGGGFIKSFNSTKAWGTNPASGSVVLVGNTTVTVGNSILLSFANHAFQGIVSEVKATKQFSTGAETNISVVDNRIRMQWQYSFGAWNMEAEEHGDQYKAKHESDPTQFNDQDVNADFSAPVVFSGNNGVGAIAPGGDNLNRRRWFWHILPSQWGSMIKTWTKEPLSAKDILNSAFNGAWGDFRFTKNFHTSQSTAYPLNVDALNGITISNLVSRLNSELGLTCKIENERALHFARRGDGTLTLPVDVTCMDELGFSMNQDPSKLMVLGDRSKVQVINLSLEPDWASGFQVYVANEVGFIDRIATLMQLPNLTLADKANRIISAKRITMREYYAITSTDQKNENYWDEGRWGESSRLDIPLWIYITQIIFRSYRIPRNYQLYGIPLLSLELFQSLHLACKISGVGVNASIKYQDDPVQVYPADKAFVIAKGQQLDLLDRRTYEIFSDKKTTNLRDEWAVMGDYEVDSKFYSFLFNQPIFVDGDPAMNESLFIYPNLGQSGYVDEPTLPAEYKTIHLPNPNVKISPAEVKVSVVFGIGKFHKMYGSGENRTVYNAGNISQHLIDINTDPSYSVGTGFKTYANALNVPTPPPTSRIKEVLYQDLTSAEDRADEIAATFTQNASVLKSGFYKRVGFSGTILQPHLDRVSVDISFSTGVTETVYLAKPSSNSSFTSERQNEERQRQLELYPKQRELERELISIKAIADLRSNKPSKQSETKNSSISSLVRNPVGDTNITLNQVSRTIELPDSETKWRAGHVVWLDGDSKIKETGSRLGGVVTYGSVMDSQESLDVAVRGIVPCLVKGPFKAGDTVGCDDSKNIATVGGKRAVGTIEHSDDYAGTNDVVVRVRLGGSSESCSRLKVSFSGTLLSVSGGLVDNEEMSFTDNTIAGPVTLWCVVDGVPDTEENAGGTEYVFSDTITLSNYRFVLSDTDPNVEPSVSGTPPAAAVVGGGVFAQKYAVVKLTDGVLTLTDFKCGNHIWRWCGSAKKLTLIEN